MSVSFEEIGQVQVTCKAQEEVVVGAVVKVTENGTVAPCAKGEVFAGVAMGLSGDGFAAVQVKGFMEANCGEDVTAGWNALCADGEGGVEKATDDTGVALWVWSVENGKAVFCL